MGEKHLFDAAQREIIRCDLDATLVVEAAAGTGKTTELLGRLVNVIAEGKAELHQIVAVTFTEKAAGELKLRLRARLERARADQAHALTRVARGTGEHEDAACRLARFESALAHLEDAHVNTIHGFCADLLRERPVEAHVDPRFEVLAQGADEALFDQVFDRWLETTLEAPPEGVRRALRRPASYGEEGEEEGPVARLRRAAWLLATWRDFPALWTRPPFDRDARLAEVMGEIQRIAALTGGPARSSDFLYRDSAVVRDLARELRLADERDDTDRDGREGRIAEFAGELRKATGRIRKGRGEYKAGVTREELFTAVQVLKNDVEAFVRDADADLAACLQFELRDALTRYERAKGEAGRLDFVDLLLRARDLLRDHASVRADFQARFSRIFVDEFQDTDPIQAEILLLLASDDPDVADWRAVTPVPGKLFIVGDPKQSIYRFRRADVATYWAVRDLLVERGHARPVQLSTSFRSLPAIQRCINVAFAPEMTGDRATLQADYEPLAPYRRPRTDQPAVVALPVPEPYGKRRISGEAIDESLPDAVGEFVRWVIQDSGWTVTERAGAEGGAGEDVARAIRPGDVAILFRRFTSWRRDVTRPYVEALESRQVPHLLVGGKSFAEREEIDSLITALTAIEWPDDELAVFATLKGPLFGFDDRTLLDYRQRFRRVHPFVLPDAMPSGPLAEVTAALRMLRTLHVRRNRVPVAVTIEELLRDTRAHAGLVLRPGGEQALANALHVIELARRYEASAGLSFRGFVEQLLSGPLADVSEAPVLEEGSDGVRLITVHKAKGLEFPVVVLADITARLAARNADRHLDPERGLCAVRLCGWSPYDLVVHEGEELARDAAEGVRVVYVAATRARDLLVIPAVGDAPFEERWVGVLNRAIYPAPQERRRPDRAPACPSFGKDSVTRRPDDDPAGSHTVAPGWYVLDATAASGVAQGTDAFYGVTWWDPFLLPRVGPPSLGLRHTDLISPDAPAEATAADLEAFRAWDRSRAETLSQGATPTVRLETVTARAARDGTQRGALDGEPAPGIGFQPGVNEITLVRVGEPNSHRPSGPRFGRLAHEVLAAVPLDASRETVEHVARHRARLLGASDAECTASSALVSMLLAHDVMAHARAADARGCCRREAPLTWCADDGALVEGAVDLAFEDEDGWCVLDFKTDQAIEAQLEVYRRQVAIYAHVIALATGRPARGVLVQL